MTLSFTAFVWLKLADTGNAAYMFPGGDQLEDAGQLSLCESGVEEFHHLKARYRTTEDLPVHGGGVQSEKWKMAEGEVFCQSYRHQDCLNLSGSQDCPNQVDSFQPHQCVGENVSRNMCQWGPTADIQLFQFQVFGENNFVENFLYL